MTTDPLVFPLASEFSDPPRYERAAPEARHYILTYWVPKRASRRELDAVEEFLRGVSRCGDRFPNVWSEGYDQSWNHARRSYEYVLTWKAAPMDLEQEHLFVAAVSEAARRIHAELLPAAAQDRLGTNPPEPVRIQVVWPTA